MEYIYWNFEIGNATGIEYVCVVCHKFQRVLQGLPYENEQKVSKTDFIILMRNQMPTKRGTV